VGDKRTPDLPDERLAARAEGERAAASMPERAPSDHISRQLRALYDEVANQPVPDRFRELLEELDKKLRDD
jgi:Anti-sigma factor NepR